MKPLRYSFWGHYTLFDLNRRCCVSATPAVYEGCDWALARKGWLWSDFLKHGCLLNFLCVWSFVDFAKNSSVIDDLIRKPSRKIMTPYEGIHQNILKTYFIESFKVRLAMNLGTFFALILNSSPVCGFLPFRAFLLSTLKVPNHTRLTISLFFNALAMVWKIQSTDAWACFLVLTTLATSLIQSPLFVPTFPL